MSIPHEKSFLPLDEEEKELMESLEKDEWRPVENLDEVRQKLADAASLTLKKDRRINLRLSEKDYQQTQIKAIEEGLPYQTLISSLVHKYLTGKLVQKM